MVKIELFEVDHVSIHPHEALKYQRETDTLLVDLIANLGNQA